MEKRTGSIYYKTLRTSDTGIKFSVIETRANECREACKTIANELGITGWRSGFWSVFGGISSCIFPDNIIPDGKVWKKNKDGEYMPKANSKVGKELIKRFKELPRVTIQELNSCIGFNEAMLCTIGFSCINDQYVGFVIGEDWGITVPSDCEEVTITEFKTLFNKK